MLLKDYVEFYFTSKKQFSEALGIWPSYLNRWYEKGNEVIDGKIYPPSVGDLPPPPGITFSQPQKKTSRP